MFHSKPYIYTKIYLFNTALFPPHLFTLQLLSTRQGNQSDLFDHLCKFLKIIKIVLFCLYPVVTWRMRWRSVGRRYSAQFRSSRNSRPSRRSSRGPTGITAHSGCGSGLSRIQPCSTRSTYKKSYKFLNILTKNYCSFFTADPVLLLQAYFLSIEYSHNKLLLTFFVHFNICFWSKNCMNGWQKGFF